MDISSAEPGPDAHESKATESKGTEAKGTESENTLLEQPPVHTGRPDQKDLTNDLPKDMPKDIPKVLAYGPAERVPEAPEIKADQPKESGAAPEIRAEANPEKTAPADVSAKTVTHLGGSALVPFVERAKEYANANPGKPAQSPKPFGARAFAAKAFGSGGMLAASLAAFAGIAWAVAGSYYGNRINEPTVAQTVAAATPAASAAQETLETRRLHDEIRGLKKELDTLRSSMAQNQTPDELRVLKKSIDGVRNNLENAKSEMNSSIAKLSGKLDGAQHDPAKLREISDRLEHVEQHVASGTVPSSNGQTQQEVAVKSQPAPLPPAKPQTVDKPQTVAAKQTAAAPDRPQTVSNWVVRDVYDGIALVEGPHGAIEVIEGETIPGMGTVKSIERRGSGWVVMTSRGQLEYARN